MGIGITSIKAKIKRERNIRSEDKFFIIGLNATFLGIKNCELSVGWIESEFIETQFLGKNPLGLSDIKNIKVLKVFDKESDYNNYKIKNNLW